MKKQSQISPAKNEKDPAKARKMIYKNFKNLVYFIANKLISKKVEALKECLVLEFNHLKEKALEIVKIKSLGRPLRLVFSKQHGERA